jgi:inosose dehydratase
VSQEPHQLRFAYSTINWGATCDLPLALSEIRSAGWGAVELFGHTLDWLGTPKQILHHLGDLKAATVFSGVELPANDQQRTTLGNRIAYAAEIGASDFGLVGGGRLRYRPPSDAEYQELSGFCEELAEHGDRYGVTVAYHPHVACTIETSAEIEKLLAGSDKLRLCLDASHVALVGEDPIEEINRYWDRTSYIHLKDWANGKFVELGSGSIGIDFAAILAFLQERRFAGWVVLEQSQSEISPLESARINAAYLQELGYDISVV